MRPSLGAVALVVDASAVEDLRGFADGPPRPPSSRLRYGHSFHLIHGRSSEL
jgi:hypothetical protein